MRLAYVKDLRATPPTRALLYHRHSVLIVLPAFTLLTFRHLLLLRVVTVASSQHHVPFSSHTSPTLSTYDDFPLETSSFAHHPRFSISIVVVGLACATRRQAMTPPPHHRDPSSRVTSCRVSSTRSTSMLILRTRNLKSVPVYVVNVKA